MNLLLMSAFDQVSCEKLRNFFRALEIPSDKNTSSESWSAEFLTERIVKNYSSKNRYSSIPFDKIGKAWQLHASETIIRNSDTSPWQLTSKHALQLADFWQDMSGEVCNVLFYMLPHQVLWSRISSSRDFNDDSLRLTKAFMEEWYEYHSLMLKVYKQNSHRSILFNYNCLLSHDIEICALIAQKFDISISDNLVPINQFKYSSSIVKFLGSHMHGFSEKEAMLIDELNAECALVAADTGNDRAIAIDVWEELLGLHQELKATYSEVDLQLVLLAQLQDELEEHLFNGQ